MASAVKERYETYITTRPFTAKSNELAVALVHLLNSYKGRLLLIEGLVSGKLPLASVRALGTGLYADVRSTLQVRIPDTIRITPLEADELRRFWCRTLAEELGDFKPGCDHASLVALICYALGVAHAKLEGEYQRSLPRLDALRGELPSLATSLREVARVYAEKATLIREADRLADALRDHYDVPEKALYYFRYALADLECSDSALEQLTRYAMTPRLKHMVLDTVNECLEHFPTWAYGQTEE